MTDLVQRILGAIEEEGDISRRTRVQIWASGMQVLRDYNQKYPVFENFKHKFRNTGFDGGRNPWRAQPAGRPV